MERGEDTERKGGKGIDEEGHMLGGQLSVIDNGAEEKDIEVGFMGTGMGEGEARESEERRGGEEGPRGAVC